MRYIPNTDSDIASMLGVIGVQNIDDLFSQVPEGALLREPLKLPPPLPEPELMRHLEELGGENANVRENLSFLGGGA